jgi:hypothetical protein
MVRVRFRDVVMWFVTAVDDIVVERTWRALRRGDTATVRRAWSDLVFGFAGCAVPVLLVLTGLVVWAVVALVR